MALAVTNTRTASATAGAGSITLAYSGAVTAGSTLIAGGAQFNVANVVAPAISDSTNGSWTKQSTSIFAGHDVESWLAAFENTAAATPTVTNNPAGTSADIGVFFIGEVTGASTPTSVDKSAISNTQAGTNTPSIASGVLAQADEVIFAVMTGDYGGTPTVTSLAGDGTYTTIISNPDQTVQLGHAQYKIVAVTTSDTADWSVTPAAAPNPGDGATVLLTIKAAAAAGGATHEWMGKPASTRMRFERSILY